MYLTWLTSCQTAVHREDCPVILKGYWEKVNRCLRNMVLSKLWNLFNDCGKHFVYSSPMFSWNLTKTLGVIPFTAATHNITCTCMPSSGLNPKTLCNCSLTLSTLARGRSIWAANTAWYALHVRRTLDRDTLYEQETCTQKHTCTHMQRWRQSAPGEHTVPLSLNFSPWICFRGDTLIPNN